VLARKCGDKNKRGPAGNRWASLSYGRLPVNVGAPSEDERQERAGSDCKLFYQAHAFPPLPLWRGLGDLLTILWPKSIYGWASLSRDDRMAYKPPDVPTYSAVGGPWVDSAIELSPRPADHLWD
jgi:hypothetical protein